MEIIGEDEFFRRIGDGRDKGADDKDTDGIDKDTDLSEKPMTPVRLTLF